MGWCHRIGDPSSADFKTFFAQHSTHSGTPKCWFTEGVGLGGWGGVGRGERELSSTFDQVTLFPPPLPLLIVSRLLACMHAYMNVYE